MGAYNELILEDSPEIHVQFKWGLRWQLEYRVGDRIDWGKLHRPIESEGLIIVDGISSTERYLGFQCWAISIESDKIIGAKQISESEAEQIRALLDKEFPYPPVVRDKSK